MAQLSTALPPTATAAAPTRSRFVNTLTAERHSLPLTLFLHLFPGVVAAVVYLLVAQPLVRAIHYPSLLGWALALTLTLVPLELGLLLYLGRRLNGRWSLRGVVRYTDRPMRASRLVPLGIALIIWFTVASLSLTPIDNYLYNHFFTWVPFDGAAGDVMAYLNGFSRSTILRSMAIGGLFTGFVLPAIEETYFRGFLMPRLEHHGGWAPILSAALFSAYHTWGLWGFFSRALCFVPSSWLVRRCRDLRIGYAMHVGTTATWTIVGVIAVAMGKLG